MYNKYIKRKKGVIDMKIKKKLEIVNKHIEAYEKLLENAENDDKIDISYCKECLERLDERKKELESYLNYNN